MFFGTRRIAVAALLACWMTGVASAKSAPGLKARELETERAGIKIALYEKWLPGEEKNWKQNGKVVLLVHGATWSSRCTFDAVEDFSLMDSLAAAGYDVWALDLHGYGKSGRVKGDKDWSEAASVQADIDAAADYIRALRWVERLHIFGYQWGAWPAGLFAIAHPNKVARLALFGLRAGPPEKKPAPTEHYRTNSSATATLKPDDGDLDPEFVRRRAQVCMQYDQKSPNGAINDYNQPSPLDPTKIRAATLLIMGEKEADSATVGDRVAFFQSLGSHTKWFTILSGLGKYASFERGRARFESALIAFFDQP